MIKITYYSEYSKIINIINFIDGKYGFADYIEDIYVKSFMNIEYPWASEDLDVATFF